MRFSSRSKVSMALSLFVLLALVGGFVATQMLQGHGPAAHAAGSASYAGVRGQLTKAATLSVANMPKGHVKSTGKTRAMPFRSTHAKGGATTDASRLPKAVNTAFVSARVLHNFNGVSSVDSMNINGFDLEPPDQGLCVGNGFVLDIVNLALTVYRANGTTVAGPINLNSFFGEPSTEFISDPRCYFDTASNHFFFTILAIDPTNAASHTDISVLTSNGGFVTTFRLDTTDLNDPGCPCFGDQPLFGIDQFNVYISNNEFSLTGPNFNGAQVYAISKQQLVAGNPTPNFVHFGNLGIGGTIAASVQPAITASGQNAPAEYFLNSLDPFSTFDNRVGVWAMTDRANVTTGGLPIFTSTLVTTETYGLPPSAQTPVGFNSGLNAPTSGLITNDDDRMQQVQFINDHLWSSLDTALTISGESGVRSGAAWFEIHPSLQRDAIGKATVTNQGYVASRGNYLMYPALASALDGTVEMVMTLTGPNTFPSAAYAVLQAGSHAFGGIHVVASGVTADNGFTAVGGAGRWGDYSAAVADPSGKGIWMATEYIPGTGDQFTNWGTRVFEAQA